MSRRYSRDELFALGRQRTFSGPSLSQIVFPLGGIGTGSVGLTGMGGLTDWEIFNRPNFGGRLPRTFPVIWAKETGQPAVCRVLEAPAPPPHVGGGGGDPHENGEGFPHMDGCTFRGEYPFAWLDHATQTARARSRRRVDHVPLTPGRSRQPRDSAGVACGFGALTLDGLDRYSTRTVYDRQ